MIEIYIFPFPFLNENIGLPSFLFPSYFSKFTFFPCVLHCIPKYPFLHELSHYHDMKIWFSLCLSLRCYVSHHCFLSLLQPAFVVRALEKQEIWPGCAIGVLHGVHNSHILIVVFSIGVTAPITGDFHVLDSLLLQPARALCTGSFFPPFCHCDVLVIDVVVYVKNPCPVLYPRHANMLKPNSHK